MIIIIIIMGRRKHVDFFSRPVHPVYRGSTSHAVAILNRQMMMTMAMMMANDDDESDDDK